MARNGGAQGTPTIAFGLALLVGFVVLLYLLA
jgi:hypothetical protein